MTILKIGTIVQRSISDADSNNGRIGEIVEINETDRRYRVRWTQERNGRPINDGKGLRTWVAFDTVIDYVPF
jgi:hypothetical protein